MRYGTELIDGCAHTGLIDYSNLEGAPYPTRETLLLRAEAHGMTMTTSERTTRHTHTNLDGGTARGSPFLRNFNRISAEHLLTFCTGCCCCWWCCYANSDFHIHHGSYFRQIFCRVSVLIAAADASSFSSIHIYVNTNYRGE